jgi:hypothetical protein
MVRIAGSLFKRKHAARSTDATELPSVSSNISSNHSQNMSQTSTAIFDNDTRLTSMSPIHSLNAIIFFLFFVVFGIWIPFFLTGTSFGAATVRTTFIRHCNDISMPYNHPVVDTQVSIVGLADSLFEQCNDKYFALRPDMLS